MALPIWDSFDYAPEAADLLDRGYAKGRYDARQPKGAAMTVKNTTAQYFHSTTTNALLRRVGGVDRVYVDGDWQPTETIVEYMSGQEDNVEQVSEEQARKLKPAAF